MVPVWSMEAVTSCLVQSKFQVMSVTLTIQTKTTPYTGQELTLHYDAKNEKETC